MDQERYICLKKCSGKAWMKMKNMYLFMHCLQITRRKKKEKCNKWNRLYTELHDHSNMQPMFLIQSLTPRGYFNRDSVQRRTVSCEVWWWHYVLWWNGQMRTALLPPVKKKETFFFKRVFSNQTESEKKKIEITTRLSYNACQLQKFSSHRKGCVEHHRCSLTGFR